MTFAAASPGLHYEVEGSQDLVNWDSDGVSLSSLSSDDMRIASVALDSERIFVRLVISESE